VEWTGSSAYVPVGTCWMVVLMGMTLLNRTGL
jgi:hypothetical protein